MSNIVFFLGAGASKAFGNPLTSEIMALILKKLKAHQLFCLGNRQTDKEREYEKKLLAMLYMIYPGLKTLNPSTKRHQQLMPSVTEVLSLIDHFCFYNLPPHPRIADATLQEFKYLLDRAVGELIWELDDEPYTEEQAALLKAFIRPIRRSKQQGKCTVITTNYDLIIDTEFQDQMDRNGVDFGIPYRTIDRKKSCREIPNRCFTITNYMDH
jgi:hypothetical protein